MLVGSEASTGSLTGVFSVSMVIVFTSSLGASVPPPTFTDGGGKVSEVSSSS